MREITREGITWVDIEKPTREDISSLSVRFPFHQLNLEDAQSKTQITKVEEQDEYLFIVLRFPVLCRDQGCQPSQISIFLGKDFLVTVHEDPFRSVDEVFERFGKGTVMNGKQKYGSGALLYAILDRLIDSIFPIMKKFMDNLENIEEAVFSEDKEVLYEVTKLRRGILDLRRIVSPLKRVIYEIRNGVKVQTGEELDVYFRDLADHIEKIWELSETSKEIAEIYKDTDFTHYQQRMNQALIFLTGIFTMTIPATVIGTLYGMNISLPGGLSNGQWTFLGEYTTFWVILIISFVPAIMMTLIFRKLKWM